MTDMFWRPKQARHDGMRSGMLDQMSHTIMISWDLIEKDATYKTSKDAENWPGNLCVF